MAAAVTDKFKKLARRWVGQIGAGGVADDTTTTIPLASATNLPTDTAVVAVIDRVDANGTSTASLEETIVGVVSGSNLTGCTRGAEGTAQAHSAGAVVEILFTNKTWGDLIDGILVDHDQDGSHDFTSDPNLATGLNIQVNNADPKRGFYIPASALFPATTNGCATLAQGETSTNKINYKYLAFDQSSEEYAWTHFPTPDYWDLSTVTAKFHWTAASGSGDVIWGIAGLCRSNDDALDTALGTAQTVTDTLLATGDEHTTSATSAVTIGGTPAQGDKLYLRVYRDADAGGDTLSGDAHLTGITIKFGIGQYDDQ